MIKMTKKVQEEIEILLETAYNSVCDLEALENIEFLVSLKGYSFTFYAQVPLLDVWCEETERYIELVEESPIIVKLEEIAGRLYRKRESELFLESPEGKSIKL